MIGPNRNQCLKLGAPLFLLLLIVLSAPWRSTWVTDSLALPFIKIDGAAAGPARTPLVIWLHGRDQHPEEIRHLLAQSGLRAQVIIPAAPNWHRRGLTWYPPASSDPSRSKLRFRARQLDRFLGHLIETEPTGTPIIVVGFSQGAALALSLAADSNHELRAVIAVSGALPFPLDGATGSKPLPPISILHGDMDRAVPTRHAHASEEKFRAHGHTEISVKIVKGAGHSLSGVLLDATLRKLKLVLKP